MTDLSWRPISEVPEGWRALLLTHVRQRTLRMRAKHFELYHLDERDEQKLQIDWEGFVKSNESIWHIAHFDYEAWRTPRVRHCRIVCTQIPNKEIVEGLDGDDILDHMNWETCAFVKLTGAPNVFKQKTGYSAAGIEFDASMAIALGCPLASGPAAETDKIDQLPRNPSRRRVAPAEWNAWVADYKLSHPVLPDVDRIICPAARAQFGNAVTQTMCREAFGGSRPGPR